MEDDFYILLDWDNIGFRELNDRLSSWLLCNPTAQQIEVRASPSLDGYHIYIKTFSFISPTQIFRLRKDWKDDPQKLLMDMQNKTARHRGDLFSKKIVLYNGKKYEFPEVKMFKYVRNNPRASWVYLNTSQLENTKHITTKSLKNDTTLVKPQMPFYSKDSTSL